MVFTIRGTPIGVLSIVIALLSSMGGFLFGYDTGQISGILVMSDFKERFATERDAQGQPVFNVWLEGVIVALLSVGTAFGALAGSYLADFFGRRRAMQYEVLVFIIGVIIQVTAFTAWPQVAVGRFVTGLGVGALSAAVPVYQSETVPRQIRGALVGTYQWSITAGILVAYLINYGTNSIPNSSAQWRIPVALGIFFSLILAVGIQFCPESPRWLASRGRYEEARRACAIVRGRTVEDRDPYSEAEYYDILQGVKEEENMSSPTWIDCFRPQRKTLYRTILGMALQAGQQLTGANYFFYYGTTIFQSVGLSDSFITSIILGAVNFGCTALGLWQLEAVGRRWPLIYGGLWCSFWLFVFAIAGVAGNEGPTIADTVFSQRIGSLLIASACLFILGYASTWAPGIWLFCGETFSRRTRAKQAALATTSNWIWNFLLAFFTSPITARIGFAYGFIFAGCNLVNALIAFLFVYETKDLSLESIDQMYMDPNCKAWHSTKWCPPGVSSRDQIRSENEKESQAARASWSDPTPVDNPDAADADNATAAGSQQGKNSGKNSPQGIEAKFAEQPRYKTEAA